MRDEDLELLETFLDGELTAGEAAALQVRMGREPELADELERLRADRAVRISAFAGFEPTRVASQQVVAGVATSISRRRRFELVSRSLRYVGAAAACVLVAYGLGMTGGGRSAVDSTSPIAAGTGFAPSVQQRHYQVLIRDDAGRVVARSRVLNSKEEASALIEELNRWQDLERAQQGSAVSAPGEKF